MRIVGHLLTRYDIVDESNRKNATRRLSDDLDDLDARQDGTTPTKAVLTGPVTDAEMVHITFRVIGPDAGPSDVSFSTEPAVTPEEINAFSANQYIEHLDSTGATKCLLPVLTNVEETTIIIPDTNKLTLRLPVRFARDRRIEVPIELTTNAEETTAIGMRLAYDTSQVNLPDVSRIVPGPDLPAAWTVSYENFGVPGEANFVLSGDPLTDGTISGPVADLHVATLVFSRIGPRPDAPAFGFNPAVPTEPAEIEAFPFNHFIRFGTNEFPVKSDTSVVSISNRFLRGDCNGDQRLDISDPIWNLYFLFFGGPRAPCDEGCNINGDHMIDFTDSIYALSYQLIGGPPPPYPACDISNYCAVDTCPF